MFSICQPQLNFLSSMNKCLSLRHKRLYILCNTTIFRKTAKKIFLIKSKSLKFNNEHYEKLGIPKEMHTFLHNKFTQHLRSINPIYYTKKGFCISSILSSHFGNFDQLVPKNSKEAQELLNKSPYSHPDTKLLKIAMIGVPNSGKSTLINQLIGWKICSVSRKVHTTQCSARAVTNHDLTQLVFMDTPGVVTPEEIKKYKLKTSLVVDPEKSLEQSDLIVVLHDVSNSYTQRALPPRVLRLLLLYPTIPSVLVLNKVDLIKKKKVFLDVTHNLTEGFVDNYKINKSNEKPRSDEEMANALLQSYISKNSIKETKVEKNLSEYENNISNCDFEEGERKVNDVKNSVDVSERNSREPITIEDVISGKIRPTEQEVQKLLQGRKGWSKFREVFMISALDGSGVEDLLKYLLQNAKKAPWIFSDDIITDQSPQEMALSIVREKCLEYLKHNIPYELKFKLCFWDLSESDVLSILITAYCSNKSHMKLLLGVAGKNVKQIALAAEQDLRNMFRTEVRLRINFEYNPTIESSDI